MRRRAAAPTAKRAEAACQEEPASSAADQWPPVEGLDPADRLKQLHELREQGILTEEEFTAEKRKLLGDSGR